MLLVFVNIGILLALLAEKRLKKYPLRVGLAFGAIKALLHAVIGIFAALQAQAPHAIPIILLVALVRGAIGFLATWGLLFLLERIDQIELAARLAPPGVITKRRPVVLEWIGVMATGVVCAFS